MFSVGLFVAFPITLKIKISTNTSFDFSNKKKNCFSDTAHTCTIYIPVIWLILSALPNLFLIKCANSLGFDITEPENPVIPSRMLPPTFLKSNLQIYFLKLLVFFQLIFFFYLKPWPTSRNTSLGCRCWLLLWNWWFCISLDRFV